MHEVLVNRLGGLSLPRKSVVRLTDRPDMTLDVYRGRKTTMQQQPPDGPQRMSCVKMKPKTAVQIRGLIVSRLNPLYAGGLFHSFMLDESIRHFRDIGFILSFYSFIMENSVSKQCRPCSDAILYGV